MLLALARMLARVEVGGRNGSEQTPILRVRLMPRGFAYIPRWRCSSASGTHLHSSTKSRPLHTRLFPLSLPFITDCFFLVNMAGRPGYNMNSSGERNLLRKPTILAYVRYPGTSCQEDYAGGQRAC